ncbi:hypothetical protein HD806DRAFT_545309 [Xylariaceae sp. AK1471]|nr:hypothetical protein HD806DRAFT_545309 [Xylariaceae sp. AK1471]
MKTEQDKLIIKPFCSAYALRELERRNTDKFLHAQSSHSVRPRQPRIPRSSLHISTVVAAGGPDLSGLRGVGMDSRQSHLDPESTHPVSTTRTRNTGPYDRAFLQHLIDHGIYPNRYKYPNGEAPPPPENLEEIIHVMAQPRESLSPSTFTEKNFKNFKQKMLMLDSKSAAEQVPFTNFKHLTDGSLVPDNPDRYYGARPEQLDRQHDLPILPNFFFNMKGPDRTLAVTKRQACYDSTLGAKSMNTLQTYCEPGVDFDNKAYIITSTYYRGMLNIFTIYPLSQASPGTRREYTMIKINSYALTGNIDSFRTGVGAYRNARDWAKQKRDEAIRRANETAARNTSNRSL